MEDTNMAAVMSHFHVKSIKQLEVAAIFWIHRHNTQDFDQSERA